MKSVLSSAVSQVGGLVKHAAEKIATMPFEVIQGQAGNSTSNVQSEQADVMEAMEQGAALSNTSGDDYTGFATKGNYDRYAELSGRKDGMELANIRKTMRGEFSLPIDVEEGMQKARAERKEKAQEQEYVEKQEIPTMDLLEEKEDVEKAQVLTAKSQASAEQGIGKKIMG